MAPGPWPKMKWKMSPPDPKAPTISGGAPERQEEPTAPARGLGHMVWRTLISAVQRWNRDEGFLLSAAMAYYAALAIFPLILILIAGFGLAMRFSSAVRIAQQDLLELVAGNVSPWLAEQLGRLLEGVEMQAAIGGPAGILGVLAAAVGMFVQFDSLLDRIWKMPAHPRPGVLAIVRRALFDRFQAFLMLVGIGGLVVLVFLTDLVLTAIEPYVVDLPAGQIMWRIGRTAITLGLNTLLFALIYKTLPRAPVRWRAALGGALPVAVAWEAGQYGLTAFLIGEKFSAYGVVGSFMAVMIWLYYASAAVFFGAELVQCLGQEFDVADRR
jgi:membrane protein